MKTSELLRRVWNSKTYTDFAIRHQGKDFIISADDLCFLKKLELLLYQENHLNADNQRDLAQTLSSIISRVEEEEFEM